VSRPGVAILLWAALIGALAAVLWAVFEQEDLLSVLMPACAVALTAAVALAGERAARRAARRAFEPEPVPGASWSAVLAGVAVALVLLGLEVGTFLVLIGGGLLVAALGGVLRERRLERRAR
jgi:phosphate/sulfate permease